MTEDEPKISELWDFMNKAMDQGIKEWEKVTSLERRVLRIEKWLENIHDEDGKPVFRRDRDP